MRTHWNSPCDSPRVPAECHHQRGKCLSFPSANRELRGQAEAARAPRGELGSTYHSHPLGKHLPETLEKVRPCWAR